MVYCLFRRTPIDDWRVYTLPPQETLGDGETIELPDCHFYIRAQTEADRLNGKRRGGKGQGVLNL